MKMRSILGLIVIVLCMSCDQRTPQSEKSTTPSENGAKHFTPITNMVIHLPDKKLSIEEAIYEAQPGEDISCLIKQDATLIDDRVK